MTIPARAAKIRVEYPDATSLEGIVISSFANTISVAVRDGDDAVLYTLVNGNWVSEDLEPVTIHDATACAYEKPVIEADCVCSKELAARLLRDLFNPDDERCQVKFDFDQADERAPHLQRIM